MLAILPSIVVTLLFFLHIPRECVRPLIHTRADQFFEFGVETAAEQDLEATHDYISEFDCVANAN